MSGFLLNSNNKLEFQGINSLQDLINNYSVDGTGDISDLNIDTLSTGDLLENNGEGIDWFIRTEVGGFDQLALGDHSKIEIDGDLQVNYNIITDINEDKEIFTGVTSKTIKIGGNAGIQDGQSIHSKIELDGDLQVNYNILTDNDENKEIFTGVINGDISIGGNNSTVKIGKDLFIPNNVVIQGNLTQKGETTFIHSTNIDISDNVILLNKGLTTENPNFSSGFLVMRNEEDNYITINDTKVLGTNIIQKENHGLSTDQEIFIEGYNYNVDLGNSKTFVKKFDNDTFQIKYENGTVEDDLVATFNFENDKRIYTGTKVRNNQFMGWDEMEKSFILGITKYDGDGSDDDTVFLEAKSKLMIDNLVTDSDTRIGGNITTISQENKELWKDIIANTITIGGSNSTVEIGNDLKVYKNILTDVDEDKEVFIGVTSKTIKIGSDENDARSKIEIGGDLQVNYNVLTDADEDKEFWTGVSTKHIKIGSGSSKVKFDSTDHMVVPIGSTTQRTNIMGGIRFNSETTLFEGYDSSHWINLGGVIDVDKDTHIKAEDSPNSDNDQLKFTTAGVERMRIDEFGNVGIQSNFSDVNLYLGGTDALRIPNGTDAQRPASADISHQGYIRYNTEKQIFEGFGVNLTWGSLAAGAAKTSPTGETEIGLEILDDAHLGVFTESKMRIKLMQTGNLAIGTPVVIDGETIPVAARVIVDISSNDAIRIPSGTTSERPSTANTLYENGYKGYIRWNTDFEEFEGYIGNTKWGSLTKVISQNKNAYIEPLQLDYDTVLDFYAGNAGGASVKMLSLTLDGAKMYDDAGTIKYEFQSSKLLTQTELEIDGKITMKGDIISKTDEDLEIFTAVKTNTIKIGNDDDNDIRSKTEIGGDLQVNYNILANKDEDKDIFFGVTSNTIRIGSHETSERSKTEIGGDLQVNYNILTDSNENKEIFTDVTSNTIKIGGDFFADHSKTEIGGDLQVNYNILANQDDNKEIFMGVTSSTIKIGSKRNDNNRSKTEVGGDLQVNYNILTDADEDKEIFTGVETKMITIGGTDGDVKIANTLQVRDDITLYGHILTDSDDNREIFTDITTSTIKIGGNKTNSNRSIIEIGGDLQVNFDILTNINEDKEIFLGVTSNTIKIGSDENDARSKTEIGGDLQVNYNILGNDEENISIFTNDDYIISIGNDDSTIILGNDLQVNNHILADKDEDKEIFLGVTSKTIKIGSDEDDNRSKTEIGGDLQVNYNILGNDEDNISIFTNDDYVISIGNDDSTIILGNDLQVNNHILTDADEDKEIFVGVLSNTIKIGGDNDDNRSKLEIGGDLQVNYNILTDKNEDKEIFTGVTNKIITIGGENSQLDVGELKVYKNIITNENEDKEIFTGVTSNTIKIGDDENDTRSKTEIGGDLQVNYNILTDVDEDKEIFIDVRNNNISIGGSSSKLIVGNDLDVGGNQKISEKLEVGNDITIFGDILTNEDENKNIFTGVTTSTIKLGGENSQLDVGELKVYKNIITDADEAKEIFTGVTSNTINIGGNQSRIITGNDLEVGNDIQVNRNIVADQDEDKEIFTGILTKEITIGGNQSEVIIGNDLKVNKNILAGEDENKEIFTDIEENRIKIGGSNSETFIGGTLRINNFIISDNKENKEIFTDIAENDVTIGSSSGQVIIGNTLKVSENIESETTSDKNVFTNIGIHSLSLGSLFGTVITNNDLIITGTNLLANTDTNKTIFSNIKGLANSSITIGGVDNDNDTKSTTIINGELQTNYDILSGNQDVAKNIFTDVNTSDITLGGVAGKIIINNNLEIKNSIISSIDDDKDIFTDLLTSDINIGGENSRLIPGGTVVFINDLICDVDKPKKIFETVVNNDITIGGSNCSVIINDDLILGGNLISKTEEDKYIYSDITESNIYFGHSNSTGSVIMNTNLQINKKIVSDTIEDKEIFTDINTPNTIQIGGLHSIVTTGGHLMVTQDLKAGEDRDIVLFNDIVSKKIVIGIDSAITKFSSNAHIVLPLGSTAQRINEIGAFRYNTSLKKLEFCHDEDVWQEIGGNKSIDKRTYISTESYLNANDNIFKIFADGIERLIIDNNGDMFLNAQEKLMITGLLEVTGDIFASTNRDARIFSDITDKTITIGGGTSRVIFNSSDSIVLPVGGNDNSDKTTVPGAIRFNNTTLNFEGCDGTVWVSLGGLMDLDRDTFIRTESASGSDEDYLRFVTKGNERMIINSDGNIGIEADPQEKLHVNGNIMVNGNIISDGNIDREIFVDVIDKNINIGGEQSNVIFNSKDSIVLPKGNNTDKSDLQGAIRFNSEYDVFEGYDGTGWSILNGITDADKDTFITAESSFASDNDKLKFVTSGTQRMVISETGKIGINKLVPTKQLDIVGDVEVNGKIFVNELNIDILGNNTQDFLTITGNIEPQYNNTNRIGGFSKGFTDLYLNNGIWFGDDINFVMEDNFIKIKKYNSHIPDYVVSAYKSQPGQGDTPEDDIIQIAEATLGIDKDDFTQDNWLTFLKTISSLYDNTTFATMVEDDPEIIAEKIPIGGGFVMTFDEKEVSTRKRVIFENNITGQFATFDKDVYLGGNILGGADEDKEIFNDVVSSIISIGNGSSRVQLKSTDSLIIPTGNTFERTSLTGAFRFNTQTDTFEGYNGFIWTQFAQGVLDSDKDTYIEADDGFDNDSLSFFTRNKRHLVINRHGYFGFGEDHDPSEEFDVNLISKFQKNVTLNKDLTIDDKILGGGDKDKTIFSDVSSKTITIGSESSKVIMNSTDHMVVPIGETSERTDITGAIRYNSETTNFEGYDGTGWSILNGVTDIDKDTYITAESSTDNDELHFYTNGSQRMVILDDGKIGINTNTPSHLLDVNGIGKIGNLRINNLDSNLIPIANETYSLGSEVNKFKEVFASKNGIWIGDQHKISVSNGDLKLRKRKTDSVPESIVNALINSTTYIGTTFEQGVNIASSQILLASNANTDSISNVTLSQWLDYVKQIDNDYANYVIEDIFSETSGDYVEEFDLSSWRAKKTDENTKWIYSDRKVGIGSMFETTEPSANLHINGNIQIDGNIQIESNILTNNDTDKEIFTAVNSKTITIGSGSSKVIMDSTDHLVIPVGETSERSDVTGGIRFNSEEKIFEGYDGVGWGSLGNVIDLDKDTYISAETNPTDDNDELQFYTEGVQRMIIGATGEITLHNDTTFDGNILTNDDADKKIFTGVSSKSITIGSGSSNVIMDSTDHMVVPIGETSERTSQVVGGIRYNSETLVFEGCNGTNWAALGGLSDIDKDTFISAETNPADDNDELKFVTNGTQRMIIDANGQIGIGNDFLPSTDFDVKGNAIIRGDLTVQGTRTFVNTTNLDILDNVIKINSGIGSSENANVSSGILIQSHNNNKFFGWDDGENAFILSETDKTGDEEPGNINIISKSNLKIKDLNAGNITINSDIQSVSDRDTNIFTNISTKTITIGSGSSKIKFDSTDSIILPVGGDTELEKTKAKGAIRFNNILNDFEGCDGVNWALLRGLTDLDKDTYISAETNPDDDNDELQFYTQGVQRMIIAANGKITLHNDTIFDSNILANDDVDKEIFTNISSKTIKIGSGSSKVIMDSTDHMVIPIGETVERTDVTGAIRYNSETKTFEGCHGSNQWGTLGGLSDIDGDTKIITETTPGSDNDVIKFITAGTERMIMDSNGKIGIGTEIDESKNFGLDVDTETRFKKKVIVENELVVNDFKAENISIPNIPATLPPLSLNDLMGPPKKIVVDSFNNTAIDFTIGIEPVIQYHVGFTPQKLPHINKMNIKLIDVDLNTVLLDGEILSTDVPTFEDLTTLKFSKHTAQNYYSNGVYTFYNLDLYSSVNYKLQISFQNYHPHIAITEIPDNYILEAIPPDTITTINFEIPDEYTGSTSLTAYITEDESEVMVKINWEKPEANDGVIEKYNVKLQTVEKLNGVSIEGDVELNIEINDGDTLEVTQTLFDGLLYGTKYRFQIKSQNTADGISNWSDWVISDYYTSVPEKPTIYHIDDWEYISIFDPDSIDTSVAYGIDSYIKYDNDNGQWGDIIESSGEPLFKNVSTWINLDNIEDINCSNVLCDNPGTGDKIWRFELFIEGYNSYGSSISDNNGFVDTIQFAFPIDYNNSGTYTKDLELKNGNIDLGKMTVTFKDPYEDEIGENKAGFWTAADITNIQIKLPAAAASGVVRITANVPSFGSFADGDWYGFGDNFSEFTFTKENLIGSPIFSTIRPFGIGVQNDAEVEWICGVASLKVDTIFDLDVEVTNLVSDSYRFLSDTKQLEIQSSVIDTINIEANDLEFGIGGSEYTFNSSDNDGKNVLFDGLSHKNTKLKDMKLLGELHPVNFTMKAFNLNGEISESKTINLWRDTESIISKESGLLSKRMKIPDGQANDINIDNKIDVSDLQTFVHNEALSNDELIMIDGEIRSDSAVYKDYRSKYNKNTNGIEINNAMLTNVNWVNGDDYTGSSCKWALFKFENTVQVAGTGSFAVKFTTPGNVTQFENTNYQQENGFKCYISLPSKTNNGDIFWYDINKPYEQETTGDVTGSGVFQDKGIDPQDGNTIFNIVIPVITLNSQISTDIYIMLGLEKDAQINITNIELISTE